MKIKIILAALLVCLTPMILFWGCGKGINPSAPSGPGVLNVQLSSNHSGVQFVGASQNKIYYNVFNSTGSTAPVTGSYGPLSASGVNGTFSFSINLGSHTSYQYISVEVADATSGKALAVGAAPFSLSNPTIELGPVNKGCYQVNALSIGNFYTFQTNTTSGATITGEDVECLGMSGGYQFGNFGAVGNVSCAYMGTGPMANYLTVPPTNNFEINSSTSKSFVLTGSGALASSYPLALNDVYCIKLYAGGYAWVQVTDPGVVGVTPPSFTFRVNTTLSYCAYERTTADLASLDVVSVFTLANATPSSGLAVSGPSNGAATILYANYSNSTTGWIQGFNTNSAVPVATAGAVATPNGAFGGGLAVVNGGATIVKSYPTAGIVLGYASSSAPTPTYIGNTINVQSAFGGYGSSYSQSGYWVYPYGVAADSNNSVYGTDVVGTTGCSYNVMGFPSSNYSSTGNLIPGTTFSSISCTPYALAVTVSSGVTYIYVADTGSNAIRLYSTAGGTQLGFWTSDKVSTGNALNTPSGIALNGNGKLFIANMAGTSSVIEWNISTPATPTFVAEWGPSLSSGYGSFSFNANVPISLAVDNATPPNVFVSDYGNSRVVEFKGN